MCARARSALGFPVAFIWQKLNKLAGRLGITNDKRFFSSHHTDDFIRTESKQKPHIHTPNNFPLPKGIQYAHTTHKTTLTKLTNWKPLVYTLTTFSRTRFVYSVYNLQWFGSSHVVIVSRSLTLWLCFVFSHLQPSAGSVRVFFLGRVLHSIRSLG